MKKFLRTLTLLALAVAAFAGCSQQRRWNQQERHAMREALKDYRKMVYLEDLDDNEYLLFTDNVTDELESSYPVYATFIQMQGVDDTVDMVVVTTIVEELDADARNMRHLYPYPALVAQGILPAGLDRGQQKAFYECFASKVNSTYSTMRQFFNAVLADTTDTSQLAALQTRCAADLFDWSFTEIDVVEID